MSKGTETPTATPFYSESSDELGWFQPRSLAGKNTKDPREEATEVKEPGQSACLQVDREITRNSISAFMSFVLGWVLEITKGTESGLGR